MRYIIRKTVQHSVLYGTQLICKPLSKWNLTMFPCFSEVSIDYSSLARLSAITNNRVRVAHTLITLREHPSAWVSYYRKKTMLMIEREGGRERKRGRELLPFPSGKSFSGNLFATTYWVCLFPPEFTVETICFVWK